MHGDVTFIRSGLGGTEGRRLPLLTRCGRYGSSCGTARRRGRFSGTACTLACDGDTGEGERLGLRIGDTRRLPNILEYHGRPSVGVTGVKGRSPTIGKEFEIYFDF